MPKKKATTNRRPRRGSDHPRWRGGRATDVRGYIRILVGKGHHLSDCRGYAYEHRLVAEEKLGRVLREKEHVHHENGVKADNRPENLTVFPSQAHHAVAHRTTGIKNRLPDEENPTVSCACGCGERFKKYDSWGRPRRVVSGHNFKIVPDVHDIAERLGIGQGCCSDGDPGPWVGRDN